MATAALLTVLLGACGRPAPADEAQSAAPDPAAPDPAAQATTPSSVTVDAAVPADQGEQASQSDTAATAPVLTADQVVGVVDATPGRAGVKITSENPIVAPTPTTAPPPVADTAPAGPGGVHVVQPGDTLSAIAANYGVSIQAIVDANGLTDPDNLTAGDELQIPPSG